MSTSSIRSVNECQLIEAHGNISMAFIFEPVWPILYVFHFIGSFPCKKVYHGIEADVQLELQPLPWPRVMLPIITNGIVQILAFVYVWYNDGMAFLSEMKSMVDVVTFMCTISTGTIVAVFTFIHNLQFRHKLQECQMLLSPITKKSPRKVSQLSGIYTSMVSLSLVGNVIASINFAYVMKLKHAFFESLMIRVAIAGTLIIANTILLTSLLAFSFAFGEITQTLIHGIDLMIADKRSLTYCYSCLRSFQLVSNSMQKHFLVYTISCLLGIVGFMFYGFSFFLSQYYLNIGSSMNFFSSMSFCLLAGQILYFLNSQSQELKEKYEALKDYVLSTTEDDYWKDMVLHQINKFRGYSACEYYFLGKSFLSSHARNLVTYLVILIEFKLSES